MKIKILLNFQGKNSKKIFFHEIDLNDFTSFFFAWTFLIFLACCDPHQISKNNLLCDDYVVAEYAELHSDDVD